MNKILYTSILGLMVTACSNDNEPSINITSFAMTRVEHGMYEECTNLRSPVDSYVYPAYPGTIGWNEFQAKYGSIDAIVQALLPTDEVASVLSTESLIYAYIDYPFGHGFQILQETIDREFDEFSICRELGNRDDAASTLIKIYEKFNIAGCEQGPVAHYPLLTLMSVECIHNQLNEQKTKELVRMILDKWDLCKDINDNSFNFVQGNRLFVAFTIGRLMRDVEFVPMLDALSKDALMTSFINEWHNPTELKNGTIEQILNIANLFIK